MHADPAPPSVQISAQAAPSLAVAGAGGLAAQQVRVRAFKHGPVHLHALETRAEIARERAPPCTLTPAPPARLTLILPSPNVDPYPYPYTLTLTRKMTLTLFSALSITPPTQT